MRELLRARPTCVDKLSEPDDSGDAFAARNLTGVQAGIEVRNGTTSGRLTTDAFYCRIE